jgi:hypothetical protein
MNTLRPIATLVIVLFACASAALADIIPIDLLGKAGPGLLPGNETGTVTGSPGSGGEIGAGITFDNVTLQLTINIGWGSGNGFTDLTGNATAGHIHGPTPSAAPASFNESVGVLIGLNNLAGWNPSATNGGFSGTVTLTSEQASFLYDGRLYINVHTSQNGPGEIRGNLVVVPEPGTFVSVVLGFGALALLRRWTVTHR